MPDPTAPSPADDELYVDATPSIPRGSTSPPPKPPSPGPPSSPAPGPEDLGEVEAETAEDDAYEDLGQAYRSTRSRWLGNPRAATRRTHLLAAVGLVLAGLSIGVGVGATTEYRVVSLEAAGSFFSLAVAGQTLYATSFNGGSVLLERSTDMGVSWTPVAVPYQATIAPGGVDWNYAVVALDGSNVVMVAATGATDPTDGGAPPSCGTNSTILLAYSPDRGADWTSTNETTIHGSVSWMNAAVVDESAAVAWVSTPPVCDGNFLGEQVMGRTSSDAGASWSAVQNLTPTVSKLPNDGHLEMTAGNDGIVVGFVQSATLEGLPLLSLYQFIAGSTTGFALYDNLSVDSTWTLQGTPATPAFLLTPNYLVPLGVPPLTAIPFGELQTDGGGLAQLPAVTSLVYLGGNTVEVAAAMPSGGGVDCWQIDEGQDAVSQSCHVPLASFLQPSTLSPPVISLLDGGGWWLAIGAAPAASQSSSCTSDCPAQGAVVHPWNSTPEPVPSTPSSAGTSNSFAPVGVSICWVSCASGGGIVAYYFSQAPSVEDTSLDALAGALFLVGGLWMLSNRRRPRGAASDPPAKAGPSSVSSEDALLPPRASRSETERSYRVGLAMWTLVWIPVAVALLSPGGAAMNGWTPLLVVACGSVGALLAVPYHGHIRRSLQDAHGVLPGNILGFDRDPTPRGFAFEPVRRAARCAAASWVVAAAVVVVAAPFLLGDALLSSATTFDSVETSTQLGFGGYLLAALVVLFVVLRGMYHESLADAASLARTRSSPPKLKTRMTGDLARHTRWGARLLALNPFAGLVLGWALQPAFPEGPYLLPGVFLVSTLLGAALLGGGFGRSTWAPTASPTPARPARGAIAL